VFPIDLTLVDSQDILRTNLGISDPISVTLAAAEHWEEVTSLGEFTKMEALERILKNNQFANITAGFLKEQYMTYEET
jgi:hypothetical protein